jgi:hypothetical protein
MKLYHTAILCSGILLVSCEKSNPQGAGGQPPQLQSAQPQTSSAEARPVTIPGFKLLPRGALWPDSATLLAHWDEIKAQVLGIPSGARRDARFALALSQLAAVDPARAAKELAEWKHYLPSAWADAASKVVAALWKSDPAAAANFITSEVPPAMQGRLWTQVLVPLTPQVAAPWVSAMPHSQSRLRTAGSILLRWQRRDPEAAAAWFDSFTADLHEADMSIVSQPNYFYGDNSDSGRLDHLEATRRAFEAAKSPLARRHFANAYLREVAATQPENLADITATVEHQMQSGGGPTVRDETALAQMRSDPAAYIGQLTTEEMQNLPQRFKLETIQEWARKDSAAAAQWAVSINHLDGAPPAITEWYRIDAPAATSYALGLPTGPIRDKSLEQLCNRLSLDRDFETAEKCRIAISDRELARVAGLHIQSGRNAERK